MIELSRALIRQFRAVLRKSVMAADPRGPAPMVVGRAGRQGLTLSCQQGKIGARHHTPGTFPTASVVLPFSTLTEIENGRGVVSLEQIAPFKGRASWPGDEGPRVIEFDTADPGSLPPAPEPARNGSSLESGFLSALDDAARTASRDAGRYACHYIQLRGRDGAVVATDGKQLLLQDGFSLPWKEDHFLPALPVFGGRELPRDQLIKMGLAKESITLEVGPWLFDFRVEEKLRFPNVDNVIPNARGTFTRVCLDARDIEELIQSLPRMPGHDDQHQPVTLDLGGVISVRSRSEKGESSEVALCHSKKEGRAAQVAMDRRFLLRALKLGFREILVASDKQPLLCKDARRTYLWMPLGEADAVPAVSVAHPVPGRAKRPSPVAHPVPTPSTPIMPSNEPRDNGPQRNGSAEPGEVLDPITEAEELRLALQSALSRTSRLIAALKQQKRQSRVVESALASLRRLQ